jgi:hypothetical protein
LGVGECGFESRRVHHFQEDRTMGDVDRHVAALIQGSNALREAALVLQETARLTQTSVATQAITEVAATVNMHAGELDAVAQNVVRTQVQQAAAGRRSQNESER